MANGQFLDLVDQSRGGLVVLEDLVVIGQLVDVADPGGLGQQMADGNRRAIGKVAEHAGDRGLKGQFASFDQPQDRGGGKLHRH